MEKVKKNKMQTDKKQEKKHNKVGDILKDYAVFYKSTLMRKHIVSYILSVLIFAFFMSTFITNLKEVNQFMTQLNQPSSTNLFMLILTEKIPLVFIVIIAGITPYFYIPVVGILGAPYAIALHIMNLSGGHLIVACIGAILQLFAISLAIATGIYYCSCSTKRFRYDQKSSFGIDQVKEQLYETRKEEEKLQQVRENMQKKRDKMEKNNVKVKYLFLVVSFIISALLLSIATIITGV